MSAETATKFSDLSAADIEYALAVFRRCHELLLGKLGLALLKATKDVRLTDNDVEEPWKEGYLQGREVGIACFPDTIDDIPIGDILRAVRGPQSNPKTD